MRRIGYVPMRSWEDTPLEAASPGALPLPERRAGIIAAIYRSRRTGGKPDTEEKESKSWL